MRRGNGLTDGEFIEKRFLSLWVTIGKNGSSYEAGSFVNSGLGAHLCMSEVKKLETVSSRLRYEMLSKFCYKLIATMTICIGIVYLITPQFMPHHSLLIQRGLHGYSATIVTQPL